MILWAWLALWTATWVAAEWTCESKQDWDIIIVQCKTKEIIEEICYLSGVTGTDCNLNSSPYTVKLYSPNWNGSWDTQENTKT